MAMEESKSKHISSAMKDEPFMKIRRRVLYLVLHHTIYAVDFAGGKKRIWIFGNNNNKTITTKYQSDIPNITMHNMHTQMDMDGNPIGSMCGDVSVQKERLRIPNPQPPSKEASDAGCGTKQQVSLPPLLMSPSCSHLRQCP